jgi:hypothetical protein
MLTAKTSLDLSVLVISLRVISTVNYVTKLHVTVP